MVDLAGDMDADELELKARNMGTDADTAGDMQRMARSSPAPIVGTRKNAGHENGNQKQKSLPQFTVNEI